MGIEAFRYDGKRALVVGGATGMGAAAAQIVSDLGGEVVVMDYADVSFPVAKSIKVDLRNPADVDKALDEVGGPVHALFSCAGVADGTEGIMKINFIAHRHIIDRLVEGGKMPSGSAIGMISSVAGLGWENNLETLGDFLDTPDYESGAKWVEAHEGTDNYFFSKQAINAYVGREAFPLLKQGIRINAILPGPTDTPLARANADTWLDVRVRLPRGGRRRDARSRADGQRARVPVQRRRERHQRRHAPRRQRPRELRRHRLVPRPVGQDDDGHQ